MIFYLNKQNKMQIIRRKNKINNKIKNKLKMKKLFKIRQKC